MSTYAGFHYSPLNYSPGLQYQEASNSTYKSNNLGGEREPVSLPNVKSYPLTADEYETIYEMIPKHNLTNQQTALLSIGISFILTVISLITTAQFHKNTTSGEIIIWTNAIILFVVSIIAASSIIAFIWSICFPTTECGPFNRIDKNIRKVLGI